MLVHKCQAEPRRPQTLSVSESPRLPTDLSVFQQPPQMGLGTAIPPAHLTRYFQHLGAGRSHPDHRTRWHRAIRACTRGELGQQQLHRSRCSSEEKERTKVKIRRSRFCLV